MATSKNWQLFIHDGRHNHAIGVYHHDHAQAAQLTEEQLIQTKEFRKSHMPLRNMLQFFQELNVDYAVRYNMPLLEAVRLTPTDKNFTVETTFMRNETYTGRCYRLAKRILSLVLPLDPGTTHIGSMFSLHIERYRSQGLDQDWVRDPVGEPDRHGSLGVQMDRTGGMIVIGHLAEHQHFVAVSETLFSHVA
ncbi:hypothetical protein M9H77_25329 [Catharanthus roseus]|uniref:Uncharacterized protein n=1 Tax=Catharanthus roseus TaxID=4058 RepID=A0ACC0AAL3_CATRO|nr:hypothetical protein M9H77_25329 [Catharanthus roseus]